MIFIYLTGLGLNCSMWDLVSWPGIEPRLPDWKLRVLATGSPEKSLLLSFDDFRGTENNHYTNHPENRKRGITSFPKTGVINFKPRQYQDKKRKPESFVLLSVNVKNLNKLLTIWIQQYIPNKIHHDQSVFILRMPEKTKLNFYQ